MKLSDLINDFIDLKIEGPPVDCTWRSIEENAHNERKYYVQIDDIKKTIDSFVSDLVTK